MVQTFASLTGKRYCFYHVSKTINDFFLKFSKQELIFFICWFITNFTNLQVEVSKLNEEVIRLQHVVRDPWFL